MAGTTYDFPPPFDFLGDPGDANEPIFTDFSTDTLYNPFEDLTDATSESMTSPASPLSPALAGSYPIQGRGDDWKWEGSEYSPASEAACFGEPTISSVEASDMPASPAINPLALSYSTSQDVTLGREGLNDTKPIFQSSSLPMTLPKHLATPEADISGLSAAEPAMMSAEAQRPASERNSSRGLKRKSSSSPDDTDSQRSSLSPPPMRRRSSDNEDDFATQDNESGEPKKLSHNLIEKRYRTNLNDKIGALRDAVPALRVVMKRPEYQRLQRQHQSGGKDGRESTGGRKSLKDEDLGGLQPANKLNKSTILSKATEYIMHLERQNQALSHENALLKLQVNGQQLMVMSSGGRRGVWN